MQITERYTLSLSLPSQHMCTATEIGGAATCTYMYMYIYMYMYMYMYRLYRCSVDGIVLYIQSCIAIYRDTLFTCIYMYM